MFVSSYFWLRKMGKRTKALANQSEEENSTLFSNPQQRVQGRVATRIGEKKPNKKNLRSSKAREKKKGENEFLFRAT
jgi:hypothetical protein